MPAEPRTEITTILFTDLVGSTDLVQRVGDETAQHVFETHHQLLGDLLAGHGGEELQWLGDGLMAAFSSTADAVRCAIAMQRGVHETGATHRLAIRVGLNVGEILRQETGSGYFGTPVVVAHRLCDRADTGQILCTNTVAGLLAGRKAFRFDDVGAWELKGIEDRVGVCQVHYEIETATPAIERAPFVGRTAEMATLDQVRERATSGEGGLVFAVGEPGIGKTRLIEEFTSRAERGGALTLWGRCYEGEWAPPYAPFAEALCQYVDRTDPHALAQTFGAYASVLTALVPRLTERLPDLTVAVPLQPDEERYRLFDAVVQVLLAVARDTTTVVVLDDLHWADGGTLALLRHAARFVRRAGLLLVGTYRDVDLTRQHPLGDTLAGLRREPGYERVLLKGLAGRALAELIESVTAQEAPRALVDAIDRGTDGNPFFVREIVRGLATQGRVGSIAAGTPSSIAIEDLGIPEGVRQVIGQRLSRLSDEANGLLLAASGFGGSFRFEVAWQAAELDENRALDALDEALDAQVLRATGDADVYDFGHALFRHTLYTEMNAARQVRLHRRIAEGLERVWAGHLHEHGAEIARQYQLSSVLPGSERGVPHCLAAADRAERAAAHEEAATFLRMALELLPADDPQRPRLEARLGLALAWAMDLEDATDVASEAATKLAAYDGEATAADYLAEASDAVWAASFNPLAWRLAEQGMRYIGSRRDPTWFRLCGLDLARREAAAPDAPGIHLDAPERAELAQVLSTQGADLRPWTLVSVAVPSRDHVRTRFSEAIAMRSVTAGEYQHFVHALREEGDQAVAKGQLAGAALSYTVAARFESALGNLQSSHECHARALELAERLPPLPFLALQMSVVQLEYASNIQGEGSEQLLPIVEDFLAQPSPENQWVLGAFRAVAADLHAQAGHETAALRWLALALPAIERGPGWAINYPALACLAANVLWVLERRDHIESIERNLRAKVVTPDFRYPHMDGRLALAKLLALQGHLDEAREWFSKARRVLEEEGARPLRAVVDFEEALAHVRRGAPGDHARARSLIAAAAAPFDRLGMTGWLRRARSLEQRCATT